MKEERRAERRRAIEAAAYEMLAEKGYKATSMLAIAKRAAASNETLYKWYGNKQALFLSMVEANAREASELLARCLDRNDDPLAAVRRLGPLLLRIVLGEKAVALNRAAAGDAHETGQLGRTIAAGGKQAVLPMLARVFGRARAQGRMRFDDASEVAEIYSGLLIGDLQIERVIGVRDVPGEAEIEARSERACDLVLKLFA